LALGMDTTTHRVIVGTVASVFIANTGSDTVSIRDGQVRTEP
jgi:hypothetical protein